MSHQHGTDERPPSNGYPIARIAAFGFFAIGGTFLLLEHRAHVLGAFPWLLLLACPLLHIFMHLGHGDHRRTGRDEGKAP